MRRLLSPLLVAAALAAGALSGGPAAAAMLGDATVPFSAERTVTVNGRSYTGKLFSTPGRQRHEQDLLGMREVFILDAKAAQGWLVMPSVKTYVEFPFPALMADLGAPDLTRSPQGQETIHGIRTTKYRVDHTAEDGTRARGFVWVSRSNELMKLDLTVTRAGMAHPMTIGMELSNLLEEAQDPSLFEVPQGFVKLPAEALGPLMGGGKGG